MKALTPKEEEIMQLFWHHGPMPVRQLLELYSEPRPHFNTLSTMVRILEDKGCLTHTPCGKSFVYEPLVSEAELGRRTVRSAIARFFGNSPLRMVSALVKEEEIDPEELRKLLDEIENG